MKLSEIFATYHEELTAWIDDSTYNIDPNSPNNIYKNYIKQSLNPNINFSIIINIDIISLQINVLVRNIYIPTTTKITENEHFENIQCQFFGTDLNDAKNIAIKFLMTTLNNI